MTSVMWCTTERLTRVGINCWQIVHQTAGFYNAADPVVSMLIKVNAAFVFWTTHELAKFFAVSLNDWLLFIYLLHYCIIMVTLALSNTVFAQLIIVISVNTFQFPRNCRDTELELRKQQKWIGEWLVM